MLRRLIIFAFVGMALGLLDFFVKSWVSTHIPLMGTVSFQYPYGGIAVFQNFSGIDFSINHVINTGAAWGILATFSKPLFILRIIVVIALFIYALFFNEKRERDLPFLLILTGALGNIIDFFIYGHVIDMFYFVFWGYSYPVFNLADSWICIGISLLVLYSLFPKKHVQSIN